MSLGVLDPSLGGYVPIAQQQELVSSPSSSTSSQDSIFSRTSSETSVSTQSSISEYSKSFSGHDSHQACPGVAQAIPLQQRRNPRRSSSSGLSKPPSLVRQDERKALFVNDLVDSATNLVEVIWPLSSSPPCQSQAPQARGVLPLRRYIEETLRRSRTSYSTLQVALYYLILIKPHIPKCASIVDQPTDGPCSRAMQCGRRMFLAALILASKYLQDRNYSAKAWSKMSGLKVCEINTNERMFLSAVCWKLHIPDCIFKRWTDVVLRFTTLQGPPTPGQSSLAADNKSAWKLIIPVLTPDLDDPRMLLCLGKDKRFPVPPRKFTSTLPPITATTPWQAGPLSQENTPSPATVLPHFLEPKPELQPPTPALARLGFLPTPQMTPSSVASNTPAASVYTTGSGRPSMCMAMAQAQSSSFCRSAFDQFPTSTPCTDRDAFSRRTSFANTASSGSSPESLISDRSSSSRSSSMSSVSAASACAPSQACLAKLATCRRARLPMPPPSTKGTATELITIMDDADMLLSPDMASCSLDDGSPTPVPATARPARPSPQSHLERCLKRTHSRTWSSSDRSWQELLSLDGHVTDDDMVPESPLAASADMSAVDARAVQPPATLRRASSGRMPVEKDMGRKRTCCAAPGQGAPQSGQPATRICFL